MVGLNLEAVLRKADLLMAWIAGFVLAWMCSSAVFGKPADPKDYLPRTTEPTALFGVLE
jgi:hypothetical protein